MALRKVDNPSTGCRQAHKWSGASVPELRIQASLLLPWLEHTARTTVIYLGQEHKTRVGPRGHGSGSDICDVTGSLCLCVSQAPLKFPYYENTPHVGEIDGTRRCCPTRRRALRTRRRRRGWAPLPHELLRCQAGSAASGEKLLGRGAVRLTALSSRGVPSCPPYGDWTGFTWAAGPVRSWGAASQGPVRPVHARFPSPAGTLPFPSPADKDERSRVKAQIVTAEPHGNGSRRKAVDLLVKWLRNDPNPDKIERLRLMK
ncbi:hypothetical protein BHM03_00021662 [Ensete ventricosum]|uniref:Uncharacterized protein n=1 Tax=Ensete ventricosum TaxID=4639 RepID=A0A445MG25_ENSVE|nr:hypothetical protein BHM03_00021662 [Ensete ventricosum]